MKDVLRLLGLAGAAFFFVAMIMVTFSFYANKPSLKPGQQQVLMAPFAKPASQAAPGNGLQALYDPTGAGPGAQNGPLAAADRPPDQVGKWLQQAVPEILSVDPSQYDDHLKRLASGMDANGLSQYQAFMDSSNILAALRSGGERMGATVDDMPQLLNEGVIDGRHRWLMQAPVTLTFLPADASSYQNTTPQTQRILVMMQVGRVAPDQGAGGLEIETFSVTKNPGAQGPQ